MLSRTIEAVEINNKTFFYDFHVECIDFSLFGHTIETNKWLRFEEWEQIYEKLNEIAIIRSKTRNKSRKKSFTIGNYIKVTVKRLPLKSYHRDLFEIELEKCAAEFLQIDIRQISSKHEEDEQSEINGNTSFEDPTELNCQHTQICGMDENSQALSVCDLITPEKPDDEEPIRSRRKRKSCKSPKSVAPEIESPTSASTAKRNRLSEELFTDSQECDDNESQAETIEEKQIASNANRIKSRPGRKKTKFATPKNDTSQSEPEVNEQTPENQNTEPVRRTKRASAKKIMNYKEINSEGLYNHPINVSQQLKKNRTPKVKSTLLMNPKLKSKKTKKLKIKHRDDNLTPPSSQESESSKEKLLRTPTKEELEQNKEINEKRLEIYSAFSKNLQNLLKPPPEVEIVTLNHMNTTDLIATFDEFKPQLDKCFGTYKEQKRFHFISDTETLHLLMLNVIERKQVISMMSHLMSVYEPNCDGVPTYTDIFTNIMAPEWILLIFMKQYNLARQDAIERIKTQRDIEALNQTQTVDE